MPTKVIVDVFLIKDGSKMSRWFIITFLAEATRSVTDHQCFQLDGQMIIFWQSIFIVTMQFKNTKHIEPLFKCPQIIVKTRKEVGNTIENLLFFNFVSKKCGFVFQQRNFQRKYIATRNYEKFRLHN